MAEVVAVEQVGEAARAHQFALDRDRDRRLARGRQPGQPERRAALAGQPPAHRARQRARVPADVRASARARRRARRARPRPCPAATVSCVRSSIRMNAPVARLSAYGSASTGAAVRSVMRPMSLSPSASAGRGLERGDVHPRGDRRDVRPHAPRRVLEQVAGADARRRLDHPAHGRLELARDLGLRRPAPRARRRGRRRARPRAAASPPSAARALHRPARRVDRGHPRARARGQHDDLVAGGQHAAGDAPRVAAVVAGADRPLDREAHVVEVAVAVDLDRLELRQQRRRRVPRQPRPSGRPRCRPRSAEIGTERGRRRSRAARRARRTRPRSRGSAPRRSRRDPSCSRTPPGAGCRAARPGTRAGATARAGPCGRRSAPAPGPRSRRR